MRAYPLNFGSFANLAVSASYADTSSFIEGKVPYALHTQIPSGSIGPTGTNGGNVYLLSSSLLVCLGGTTTTTTTTSTSTTTTTTVAPIPTTTTTTTTTTLPPATCSGACFNDSNCASGCYCVGNLCRQGVFCKGGDGSPDPEACIFYEGFITCPSGDPCGASVPPPPTPPPVGGGGGSCSGTCNEFLECPVGCVCSGGFCVDIQIQ